jgi:hypothetical protein
MIAVGDLGIDQPADILADHFPPGRTEIKPDYTCPM